MILFWEVFAPSLFFSADVQCLEFLEAVIGFCTWLAFFWASERFIKVAHAVKMAKYEFNVCGFTFMLIHNLCIRFGVQIRRPKGSDRAIADRFKSDRAVADLL